MPTRKHMTRPKRGGKLKKKKTHSLCVNLIDIGQSLRKDVAGHLIAVLVPELGCLPASTIHRGSGIRYRACHDAADGGRDLEDMSDGRRIDEFVLRKVSQTSATLSVFRVRFTYRNLLL